MYPPSLKERVKERQQYLKDNGLCQCCGDKSKGINANTNRLYSYCEVCNDKNNERERNRKRHNKQKEDVHGNTGTHGGNWERADKLVLNAFRENGNRDMHIFEIRKSTRLTDAGMRGSFDRLGNISRVTLGVYRIEKEGAGDGRKG